MSENDKTMFVRLSTSQPRVSRRPWNVRSFESVSNVNCVDSPLRRRAGCGWRAVVSPPLG